MIEFEGSSLRAYDVKDVEEVIGDQILSEKLSKRTEAFFFTLCGIHTGVEMQKGKVIVPKRNRESIKVTVGLFKKKMSEFIKTEISDILIVNSSLDHLELHQKLLFIIDIHISLRNKNQDGASKRVLVPKENLLEASKEVSKGNTVSIYDSNIDNENFTLRKKASSARRGVVKASNPIEDKKEEKKRFRPSDIEFTSKYALEYDEVLPYFILESGIGNIGEGGFIELNTIGLSNLSSDLFFTHYKKATEKELPNGLDQEEFYLNFFAYIISKTISAITIESDYIVPYEILTIMLEHAGGDKEKRERITKAFGIIRDQDPLVMVKGFADGNLTMKSAMDI